jgi:hypothetical protein
VLGTPVARNHNCCLCFSPARVSSGWPVGHTKTGIQTNEPEPATAKGFHSLESQQLTSLAFSLTQKRKEELMTHFDVAYIPEGRWKYADLARRANSVSAIVIPRNMWGRLICVYVHLYCYTPQSRMFVPCWVEMDGVWVESLELGAEEVPACSDISDITPVCKQHPNDIALRRLVRQAVRHITQLGKEVYRSVQCASDSSSVTVSAAGVRKLAAAPPAALRVVIENNRFCVSN